MVLADPNSIDLTKTGEVFGSPLYISPEQWQAKGLDCRSDIYSMGSIMYRTLTNRPIFQSNDVVEIMRKHMTEKPPSFASIGVNVPPELESIVFKALEKEPEFRYQTMSELMEAIQQISASLNRASASTGYSAKETTLPPPVVLQSGTIKDGNTISNRSVADSPSGARNEPPSSTPPKSTTQRNSKMVWLAGGGVASAIALVSALLLLGHNGHKDSPSVEPIYVNLSKNHGGPAATLGPVPVNVPAHTETRPFGQLDITKTNSANSAPHNNATESGANSNIQMGQSHFTAAGQSNFPQAGSATPQQPTNNGSTQPQPDTGAGIQPFTQTSQNNDTASSGSRSEQQQVERSEQKKTATKKPVHKPGTNEPTTPKHKKKEGGLKNAIKNFFKKF